MLRKNIFVGMFAFNSIVLGVTIHAYAQGSELSIPPQSICEVAQTLDHRQQPVYFTQILFEDNAQELGVIALDAQKMPVTKRITYHQKQTVACQFPTVAITRASDWGWYLAWAHEGLAYYARMDGEALVFPPPKLLPVTQVTKIEFVPDATKPTMRLQTQGGATQLLISEDEGRHWHASP